MAIPVIEAELGGAFHNAKKVNILRLILDEMGLKQKSTTIFVDNNIENGICKKTIKRQQSCAMNGHYFW